MKKFIFSFIALMLTFAFSAQAQTAEQTGKLFDNVSVGVTVGATTPLSFNSVFPLNTMAGLRIQKDFTPAFGVQLEGDAFFNANNGLFMSDAKTFVKGTNVGINAVVNLTNAFGGYKGTPRFFEVSAVVGPGWIHEWDTKANYLSGKTALDLAFNLGANKAHSIVITPAVYWNMNKFQHVEFNKNLAQLALTATYVYHFKTSNGTHHFKTFDVGAMMDEITRLNQENGDLIRQNGSLKAALQSATSENTVQGDNNANVATPKTVTVTLGQWFVTFEKGSAELSSGAQDVLNSIPNGTSVIVKATASPEGSTEFNQELSQRRADNVASFLTNKGVNVMKATGLGVTGPDSQRIATVEIAVD